MMHVASSASTQKHAMRAPSTPMQLDSSDSRLPSVEAQGSRASREDEEGTADEPNVLPEMDELGPVCGGVVGDRPVGMADHRGTEIEEHQEQGEVAGGEAEDQRDPARDLDGRRPHRPNM